MRFILSLLMLILFASPSFAVVLVDTNKCCCISASEHFSSSYLLK